ncbi:hypothetical protein TorRG33x02_276650 [Trema orientale]|uniref:Uncharacterized protein n=1 Tax=Trema orientale TaxID=63057 RepID=A0A2P5CQE0_TREOI|nr:hypothetical protein TorRG33x02_276650 [Trema orientale]
MIYWVQGTNLTVSLPLNQVLGRICPDGVYDARWFQNSTSEEKLLGLISE